MLIHDFDVFRWILDDEAATVYATGSVLTDPNVAKADDVDVTAVAIRTKSGRLALINTNRRAAYGYDQRFEVLGSKGMLQAGNHRPTEVVAYTDASVSADKPEHFFLERYRVAYAARDGTFLRRARLGQADAHVDRRWRRRRSRLPKRRRRRGARSGSWRYERAIG